MITLLPAYSPLYCNCVLSMPQPASNTDVAIRVFASFRLLTSPITIHLILINNPSRELMQGVFGRPPCGLSVVTAWPAADDRAAGPSRSSARCRGRKLACCSLAPVTGVAVALNPRSIPTAVSTDTGDGPMIWLHRKHTSTNPQRHPGRSSRIMKWPPTLLLENPKRFTRESH